MSVYIYIYIYVYIYICSMSILSEWECRVHQSMSSLALEDVLKAVRALRARGEYVLCCYYCLLGISFLVCDFLLY